MKSVGFKEWALVCEALGRGEQRVIIRKGGLAEGRGGFAFKHREFFLFPTFFHEQLDKVRLPGDGSAAKIEMRGRLEERNRGRALSNPHFKKCDGAIEIRYFAEVEEARLITSWAEIEALEPLHILKPEVVRERFGYGNSAGVHVAWVRVAALDDPWILHDLPRYGGCRSWVELPAR